MEVKFNNSIDIQTPVKKKRPRIGSTVSNVTEDSSTYVKSTNYNKGTVSNDKKSFDKKKKFTGSRKPSWGIYHVLFR